MVQVINTVTGLKPRSWDMSHDRKLVVVGYDNGMLQVRKFVWHILHVQYNVITSFLQVVNIETLKDVWLKERAHEHPILDCFFSPNDSKIITCDETAHKVDY